LSELVDRAEAGEEVTILRRGKAVAKLVPIERPLKPIDMKALRALTTKMPHSDLSGAEILREMRDSRY
jgi:antitoxin (DNA-binding transcriptional repressor) of toxin-antitoxin stability system